MRLHFGLIREIGKWTKNYENKNYNTEGFEKDTTVLSFLHTNVKSINTLIYFKVIEKYLSIGDILSLYHIVHSDARFIYDAI